jgi:surfeit locus 1 family protein
VKRFPIGLTLAAAVALVVLIGLGVWQLRRLAWKADLLARIAALQHAPARTVNAALAAAARGEDVGYVRVEASCQSTQSDAPAAYRYAVRGGQVGWRLLGFCPLTDGPYAGVVLDRGLVGRFAGQMSPSAAAFPAPAVVVGVLRAPGRHSMIDTPPQRLAGGSTAFLAVDPAALRAIGGAHVAPYYLAVERERPAPPGVTPAALPQDIPNNHFVYALTWFGLAGVLALTWASFVRRRMAGP